MSESHGSPSNEEVKFTIDGREVAPGTLDAPLDDLASWIQLEIQLAGQQPRPATPALAAGAAPPAPSASASASAGAPVP